MLSTGISQSKNADQTQNNCEPLSNSQEPSIPKENAESERDPSGNTEIPQEDNPSPQELQNPADQKCLNGIPQSDIFEQIPTKTASQLYMARAVIKEGRITNVPAQSSFLVSATNSTKKYAVQLHPETCSCPSTRTCHHILAAKISAGLPIKEAPKDKINLTKLSKNSKKKADKKSGRKKPRLLDVDVEPAPDSLYMTTPKLSTTVQLSSVEKKENMLKARKKLILIPRFLKAIQQYI